MPLELDLMPIEERPPEPPAPKTVVVRYGYLKQIGEYVSDVTQKVGCGSKLVCRTERGTEICEMLTTTCSNGGCGKSISREKMLEYFNNSGGQEYPFSEEGRILRVATVQDLQEQEKLDENRKAHVKMARDLVARYHLQMKIVEVEYLLGQERIIYYFTSEHRVDFRTLVRDLAHNLHSRIEMRQVGARDDARITADYEKCGQHCCCKQFLKVLTPISMRSAKIQKATLDPAKISGRCGRLMCCLRYEDQTYEELRKKLPKKNTRVKTPEGEGWVVDGQILTQLVLVLYDDGKRGAVPMEQIEAFDIPKPKLPDGRTMQGPHDRPPEERFVPRGPGGPGGPPRGPRPPIAGGPPRPAGLNVPPGAPNGTGPNAAATAPGTSAPIEGRPPQGPRPPRPQQGPGPRPPIPPRGPGGQQPGQRQGQRLPPPPPQRPKPGAPLMPRPGETGDVPKGDLADDIDDLIADAMDSAPPVQARKPAPPSTSQAEPQAAAQAGPIESPPPSPRPADNPAEPRAETPPPLAPPAPSDAAPPPPL